MDRVKKLLKQKDLGGFLVTNPINIFYLTGFKGLAPYDTEREAILIVTPRLSTLITAKLYQAEAKKIASSQIKTVIVRERSEVQEATKKLLGKVKKVGFEEENLKYSEYKELKKLLTGAGPVSLVSQKNLVEELRLRKSDSEISKIEKAQVISQKAFGQLIKTIKPDQTEAEIAEKLEKIMKSMGAQGIAFETIVPYVKNAALPHHLTSKKKLKKGEVLLVDFGAKYQDYCADITRTIFVGKPKTEHLKIYEHVEKAQKKSIEAIKHKVEAKIAFDAAHGHFKENKLHDYFIHGLGHGIGLEVHEKPHLRATTDEILEEGMVFSVEPGLYFPNWGGVRIEDLVTIKNGKAKVLGKTQKEIIVV